MSALPSPDPDWDRLADGAHRIPVPVSPSPDDHAGHDTHLRPVVGGNSSEGPSKLGTKPMDAATDLRKFSELRMRAESFEDAQKARIAIENRLRSGSDSAASIEALESLRSAEKKLSLSMRQWFRQTAPEVACWAKETPGLGEHLMARLIGTIGHPAIASPYHWEGEGSGRVQVADEPFVRNVAKLWSYCGHGDPNRKRRKGMSVEDTFSLGNPRAKMIVHLLAEACMKCVGSPANGPSKPTDDTPCADTNLSGDQSAPDAQTIRVPADSSTDDAIPQASPKHQTRRRSPYRDVYDLGRVTYASREGWTLAHQHNAALRLTGKAILRDLWLVSMETL